MPGHRLARIRSREGEAQRPEEVGDRSESGGALVLRDADERDDGDVAAPVRQRATAPARVPELQQLEKVFATGEAGSS